MQSLGGKMLQDKSICITKLLPCVSTVPVACVVIIVWSLRSYVYIMLFTYILK